MDAAAELAAEVQRRVDDSGTCEVRMGTVTAASPLTVDVDGSAMPLQRLASYTATVGDVVLVLTSDRAGWTVLGKVVGP